MLNNSIKNLYYMDIFERLHSGEAVLFEDPHYGEIFKIASRTMQLSAELNRSADMNHIRELLSQITGSSIDQSTSVLAPFHINLGIFTHIGKNVFINHDCTFLDIGGITIEDEVLIGPKVSLITEGHPLNPSERKALIVKPIVIKRNTWIGAGAIILPGVTVGESAVVAAGAVVNKDVQANTVVAGVPAKKVKDISQ
jgi:acetyltransferase-like isoleucine patch superfamily enzyme